MNILSLFGLVSQKEYNKLLKDNKELRAQIKESNKHYFTLADWVKKAEQKQESIQSEQDKPVVPFGSVNRLGEIPVYQNPCSPVLKARQNQTDYTGVLKTRRIRPLKSSKPYKVRFKVEGPVCLTCAPLRDYGEFRLPVSIIQNWGSHTPARIYFNSTDELPSIKPGAEFEIEVYRRDSLHPIFTLFK